MNVLTFESASNAVPVYEYISCWIKVTPVGIAAEPPLYLIVILLPVVLVLLTVSVLQYILPADASVYNKDIM